MVWSGTECDRDVDFHQASLKHDAETTLFILQQTGKQDTLLNSSRNPRVYESTIDLQYIYHRST